MNQFYNDDNKLIGPNVNLTLSFTDKEQIDFVIDYVI